MLQALLDLIQLQKNIAVKAGVDKPDINKLSNVLIVLNILKTKVDDLNVSRFKTIPVDLKKLGDVVDNVVVKNTNFNTLKTKVKNLEKKFPNGTILFLINQYNTDKQNLDKKLVMWMKNRDIHFWLTMNKIVALWNIDHHVIDGMLMANLYFSNHLII